MTERPLTDYVAGINLDVSDNTMVTGVVVVATVVHMDTGDVALTLATSDGMSWLEQIGMLRAAERIASSGLEPDDN